MKNSRVWHVDNRIDKDEVEEWISNDPTLEPGVLHVIQQIKGTSLEERFKDRKISLALVANNHRRYRAQPYTFVYLEDLRVVFDDRQEGPLFLINSKELEREKEFRENKVYEDYGLHFVVPSIKMIDFIKSNGFLAPYATPDSAP
jgi:hypothetical protein